MTLRTSTQPSLTHPPRSWALAFLLFSAALLMAVLTSVTPADAAPRTCFGKKVDRVVAGDGARVRVGYRDVVWVSGEGTTVIGKPYSTICAGPGSQTIRAGKGRSLTNAGPGDDRIILHPSSNLNQVRGGTGDDYIKGSNGHDIVLAGPSVSSGDTDQVYGGGGNDRIRDLGGVGNQIFGQSGSDHLHSLGRAVSSVFGGNGTDFLYSNGGGSRGTRIEKLFGERGNDRLRADRPGGSGPALLDPGAGDDWVYGTDRADTIVFNSGIKKVFARGGDDLIVTAARGRATVDGGLGRDTISFAAHTPPGYRGSTGVFVDLAEGESIGSTRFELESLEDVIGSSFDDEIHGRPGTDNRVSGGLGDDDLYGNPADEDVADGGIGLNTCSDFASDTACNGDSPGNFGDEKPVVEIDESGVLSVIGSTLADSILVDYDGSAEAYLVTTEPESEAGGLCEAAASPGDAVVCPADRENLNGLLAYGGEGDDTIRLADSVAASLTATLNGGAGANLLIGGRGTDYISSDEYDSAGTVINGRSGHDLLYLRDSVSVSGGPGPDVLHVADPCVGGTVSGGPDKDNVVFAGADRGVRADLGKGYAAWVDGGCPGDRVDLRHDIENLEGSRYDDVLILGPRFRGQDGTGSLLGREGEDVLDSRNGRKDTVTTGAGGKGNVVRADRIDKVIWGWGLSGY